MTAHEKYCNGECPCKLQEIGFSCTDTRKNHDAKIKLAYMIMEGKAILSK